MPIKKPLIVFTPKGHLRHPECVNKMQDFVHGHFREIYEDPNPPENPTRIALCQGRIYYDLARERDKIQNKELMIVRVEQLYPLDEATIADLFKKYPTLKECLWVQEEPHNMGAWDYIQQRLVLILPQGMSLKYIGRMRSASPAVGSHALHKKEHSAIMQSVFPTN